MYLQQRPKQWRIYGRIWEHLLHPDPGTNNTSASGVLLRHAEGGQFLHHPLASWPRIPLAHLNYDLQTALLAGPTVGTGYTTGTGLTIGSMLTKWRQRHGGQHASAFRRSAAHFRQSPASGPDTISAQYAHGHAGRQYYRAGDHFGDTRLSLTPRPSFSPRKLTPTAYRRGTRWFSRMAFNLSMATAAMTTLRWRFQHLAPLDCQSPIWRDRERRQSSAEWIQSTMASAMHSTSAYFNVYGLTTIGGQTSGEALNLNGPGTNDFVRVS